MNFVTIPVRPGTRDDLNKIANALGMKNYRTVSRALKLLAEAEGISLSGSDGDFEDTPFAKDSKRGPESQKASA